LVDGESAQLFFLYGMCPLSNYTGKTTSHWLQE